MLIALFLLVTSSFATLPLGKEPLQWGISPQTLIEQRKVTKVDPNKPQGEHYTEFQEVDPVVYVDRSQPGKKIEFYFYQDELYKTLVIHLDQGDAAARYEEKVNTLSETLGKPTHQQQSSVYSIPVYHSIWEFDTTQYDLRFGAGYIYEVRTHKPTAERKQARQKDWQLI